VTLLLPDLVALLIMVALTVYVLMAGADFGGGVWDLLAGGPRRQAQRALVADAITPIWEANHVWLIFVVVLLFTCFPPAFARLAVDLHIPLMLMLIGIVLRGAAFTFRAYDDRRGRGGARRSAPGARCSASRAWSRPSCSACAWARSRRSASSRPRARSSRRSCGRGSPRSDSRWAG